MENDKESTRRIPKESNRFNRFPIVSNILTTKIRFPKNLKVCRYFPHRMILLSSLGIILSIYITGIYSCLQSGKSSYVTVGEDTYVCLYIMPLKMNNTGKYIRLAATVKADTLSAIRVLNAWTSEIYSNDTVMAKIRVTDQSYGSGSVVALSSMGVLSYQRIYRQVLEHVAAVEVNMTINPTSQPTSQPSLTPSGQPTIVPSRAPTSQPTSIPSNQPSSQPTSHPTSQPSSLPSSPSSQPTGQPSSQPTILPSFEPSSQPTTIPSAQPFSSPTEHPSTQPTTIPSAQPFSSPTEHPSAQPTTIPTLQPFSLPTSLPTQFPNALPSSQPSTEPSSEPSSAPSYRPLSLPSDLPSSSPSSKPTVARRRLFETAAVGPNEVTIVTRNNHTYIDFLANVTESVTFPVLFAIIQVEQGAVKSVAWDNFCHWCNADQCAQNTVNYDATIVSDIGSNCYLPDTSCYHFNNIGNVTSNKLCELTVYISWEGTDTNGISFGSSASRFSRLSVAQISNYTSTLEHQTVQI